MDLQYLAHIRQSRNLFVEEFSKAELTKNQKLRAENLILCFDSLLEKALKNAALTEFATHVRNMREAQTAYFAQRTQAHLDASKTLEKRIDKRIKEILKEDKKTTTVQASLF